MIRIALPTALVRLTTTRTAGVPLKLFAANVRVPAVQLPAVTTIVAATPEPASMALSVL